MYNLSSLNTLAMLCNGHSSLYPKLFHHPWHKSLYPLNSNSPSPPPSLIKNELLAWHGTRSAVFSESVVLLLSFTHRLRQISFGEDREQCGSGRGGTASPPYLHTGQDVSYILSHVKGPKLRVIPYPLGRCLQFGFQYWLGIMQGGKINNYAIPECTQTHSQEPTALWVKWLQNCV